MVLMVLKVHLEEREILAEWVLLAHLEYLDYQEFLECLVPLDLFLKFNPLSIRFKCHKEKIKDQTHSLTCRLKLDLWVQEAHQENVVQKVHLAVLDLRENMAIGVTQELLVHRVSEEAEACLEEMVNQELMGCLGEKVLMVLLGLEVYPVYKECLERKDIEDGMVLLVKRALWGQLVRREKRANMALMVLRGLLVLLVLEEREEEMGLGEAEELEELMALWVLLVSQGVVDSLVLLDIQEALGTRVTLEWRESRVVLDCKDQEENLESLGFQDHLERWGLQENLEKMERREVRGPLDLPVCPDSQDLEVKQEQLEVQGLLVSKDYQ